MRGTRGTGLAGCMRATVAYARTHTHPHVRTHAYARKELQRDAHARMHAHTHARAQARSRARTHHARARSHARTDTLARIRSHAHTHALTHARTHAHAQVGLISGLVKIYDRRSRDAAPSLDAQGAAPCLELERKEPIRAVALDGNSLAIGGDGKAHTVAVAKRTNKNRRRAALCAFGPPRTAAAARHLRSELDRVSPPGPGVGALRSRAQRDLMR